MKGQYSQSLFKTLHFTRKSLLSKKDLKQEKLRTCNLDKNDKGQ